MKAVYTKPMLTVELFSLTQSVARDCGETSIPGEMTYQEPGVCVWDLGSGNTIFVSGTCTIDGENAGYGCYNNPAEGQYVFRS